MLVHCQIEMKITKAIDCRTLAEEWVEHVVQQYKITHVCRKDLSLIEYLLREGFTLVAVRDRGNVLRVDFLKKAFHRGGLEKPNVSLGS